MEDGLLNEISVVDYLRRRGVLADEPATARALSGGVSNTVLLVEQGSVQVVLKQALERLRVADEWTATPTRAQTEAVALRHIGTLTPQAVPRVLDDDPDRHTLTIEAAPPEWTTWKDRLMAGEADVAVATWLGRTLRRWHEATRGAVLPAPLEDRTGFRQLRVDPFFGVSARRRPALAATLSATAQAILDHEQCLVMGDFSPKNVLVGKDVAWVIDFEVAHRGDAAFDLAFLACHLMMKAVHVHGRAAAIRECLNGFLTGYADGVGAADSAHLWRVTGCLLLARVVGSSPATYLTPAEAEAVEAGATRILRQDVATAEEAWNAVVRA